MPPPERAYARAVSARKARTVSAVCETARSSSAKWTTVRLGETPREGWIVRIDDYRGRREALGAAGVVEDADWV